MDDRDKPQTAGAANEYSGAQGIDKRELSGIRIAATKHATTRQDTGRVDLHWLIAPSMKRHSLKQHEARHMVNHACGYAGRHGSLNVTQESIPDCV